MKKLKKPGLLNKGPEIKMPKLKMPKLKMPQLKKAGAAKSAAKAPRLKKPAIKKPAIKTPEVKAPQILTDVARDLRDRRLLLPALALLVALVAVPMLLSASGPSPVPPPLPAAPIASEDVTAVESAVLVEQPGIRNYRKRLAALKRKNPFDQKFELPTPEEAAAGATTPDTGSTTPTVSGSADTSAPISGGAPTGGDTSASAPVDTTVTETPVVDENGTPIEQPKPEIRFYAGRVDVTVGPLGDAKTYKDVRYLDFLPNDKRPVVAFIGLGEGGEKAVFSVSSDVVETDGEGTCAPKQPAPCQFLTLRIGEQRTFRYADGQTYRLKVLDTQIVRVPDPRNDAAGKSD